MRQIAHISPVMFGDDGYWGGGERYPLELARAQAEVVPTRLITFGRLPRRERTGQLELVVLPARHRLRGHELNPLTGAILHELAQTRTVHVHQYHTALTDLVLLLGAITRRRIFVTDHGGWAPNLGPLFPRAAMIAGLLAVSRYSASFFPELRGRTTVIYGGADPRRFVPGDQPRSTILFVGRLMPHKGIDVLIEAVDPDMDVAIYGRPYDRGYRQALGRLAEGKRVRFIEDASDQEIVRAYQSARVLVLPSVVRSRYGPSGDKAELLGLTSIEAMCCGTPIVCSDIGPLPEVVADGETGYLVPAGDARALRRRLQDVLGDDRLWDRMSRSARERASTRFSWDAVAKRALDAYAWPSGGRAGAGRLPLAAHHL
jgi:alpha-maltose-1-phosphate synthase